ncbi:hypothetical protein Tco_1096981, partial [Tanacetum coccineum]
VVGYTKEIVHDFEQMLKTIFGRLVVFVSHAWRRLFRIQAPLVQEFILEFFSTCRIKDEMGLDMAGTLCFQLGGVRDFLRGAPSYTYIRDSIRRLCHRLISYNISRRGQAPEKSGARLSRGHFIGRLTHHFGLVSDDGLRGLSVVTREILLIDMERQQVAMAGAPEAAEDAPVVNKGAQAVPAPVQAPQPPPPPLATGMTMPQRLGRLEEEMQGLQQDVRSLHRIMERSMTDQGRFSKWMISYMAKLMKASGQTYQAFNGTFQGSSMCRTEQDLVKGKSMNVGEVSKI